MRTGSSCSSSSSAAWLAAASFGWVTVSGRFSHLVCKSSTASSAASTLRPHVRFTATVTVVNWLQAPRVGVSPSQSPDATATGHEPASLSPLERFTHDNDAREGLAVNPKRTLRLWRAHRLQRPPQRRHKRQRLGDGTAAKLRAEHPNHVWALDFQFDETAARRRLKLLNIIDEFTREALAIHVGHSINADGVVEVVSQIAARRGAPTHLRMDNGPELTADALRDWCRHTCTDTAYIEPGAPWENC